jgi:putative sugar O-methyltransferase
MSTAGSVEFIEKKRLFALNFPNYMNENVPTLDSKHQKIIATLNESSDWLASFNEDDIRTWSMQDDIGQLPYLPDYLQRSGLLIVNFLKFLYHKVRFRKLSKTIKESITDDIAVIENRWGVKTLSENPVNETPGKPKYSQIKGFKVNTRWMRYLYLANVICDRKLISKNGIWVDIGSYYGGVQGIVHKYVPDAKIILVDFHHQLFRSYVYLSQLYPDVEHRLGIEATLSDSTNGSFCYVHVSDFERLSDLKIDLISNFFSLGEMKRETFEIYRDSALFSQAKNLYLVNRFVSAPYFEPTYDNDLSILDYKFKNHLSNYFDVFPIHHFYALNRKVFDVQRPRNTSSPYFEMVLSKKV